MICEDPRCQRNKSTHQQEEGHWHLELNKYQRDNLLELLQEYLGWGTEGLPPFTMAHTGDWVGEIASKLDPSTPKNPNVRAKDMKDSIDWWVEQWLQRK